jgi:DNA-binding NarL/FixJ family response regulator
MFSVLVIESNEFFRKSFAGVLRDCMPSVAVEETADGSEAIAQIARNVPDMVFVDLRLPDRNGLELTKEIKAKHPETKVGIISNLDLPEYRTFASRYGADYFLDKASLSGTQVIALIEDVLLHKLPEGAPAVP